LSKRLTADDLHEALRGHYGAKKRQWLKAVVLGKLAMQVRGVKKRAKRALVDIGDIERAIQDFTPGDDASVRLLFPIGKGPPVPLLFGIVGEKKGKAVWGVFPDLGDPAASKIAQKARALSSAH
jgi:hypothetical protein